MLNLVHVSECAGTEHILPRMQVMINLVLCRGKAAFLRFYRKNARISTQDLAQPQAEAMDCLDAGLDYRLLRVSHGGHDIRRALTPRPESLDQFHLSRGPV